MPIAKAAIDRFLNDLPPAPPEFKGASEAWLYQRIEETGGKLATFKTPPRHARQFEGFAFAVRVGRSLLFYDPRTGKTWIALNWITYLKQCGLMKRKALIIAHAPVGVDEWEGQVPQHSDLSVAAIRSGPGAGEEFADAVASYCDAVLITWSTLQSVFSEKRQAPRKKSKGKPVIKMYTDKESLTLAAEFFDVVVIDEIHKTMSWDSLRFEMADLLVAQCTYRLGLTGTPFGRNPKALWAQAYLIDDGAALSNSFFFFDAAVSNKKFNPFLRNKTELVFDESKMPILAAKLRPMMLVCELKEIQNVNVLTGVVNLSMGGEQREAYQALIDDMLKLRDDERVARENIFVRLRQVATGFLPFIDTMGERRVRDFRKPVKLEWLADFAGSSNDMRCVVFHEFIHSGELICKAFEEAKIPHVWLYGGTKDSKATVAAFQEGKVNWLVANWAKGGTGINLSAADYLCFMESPVPVIERKQAQSRPLSREDRLLIVDDLVCAPVEKRILSFIEEGSDLVAALHAKPKDIARQLSLV